MEKEKSTLSHLLEHLKLDYSFNFIMGDKLTK